MSVALFVLGPPGIGKTSAVLALLRATTGYFLIEKPKWTIAGDIIAAGHYSGGTFDGADTVPYNGARAALEYWREYLFPRAALTIFDGDRFSDLKSLAFVRDAGATVRGVLLHTVGFVLDARRAARGSTQNPSWMKGRATKALRFAAMIEATPLEATTATPEELAARMLAVARR